jgi:Calcineurin-like phosphoesterase
MHSSLVQSLFDGPFDIVGDVHGEIDPLRSLMRHLGYDEDGNHPDGRRLVFVGDLTDRGPDSPAVVNFVPQLIESSRAQCVLGNRDLKVLLGDKKHDNGWVSTKSSWKISLKLHAFPKASGIKVKSNEPATI